MAVSQDLLDILACPKCKRPVVPAEGRLVCNNQECRLSYEIRDDIPIMLIDEAKELPSDEWEKVMATQPRPQTPDSVADESGDHEG